VKVLLHTCCAVCLAGPLEDLTARGFETALFFYNPNVHPLLEFRKRLKAFKVFAENRPIKAYADECYGLRAFLEEVDWRSVRQARCEGCYRMRLLRTAQEARLRGFDSFTTTLLVSPMQARESVLKAGRLAAENSGGVFLEEDWRPLFDSSHEYARRRSLYHQQYCGCVFSEEERFAETNKDKYIPVSERKDER
jgi:hypothetical protein